MPKYLFSQREVHYCKLKKYNVMLWITYKKTKSKLRVDNKECEYCWECSNNHINCAYADCKNGKKYLVNS